MTRQEFEARRLLAAWLRGAREDAGLTQRKLGAAIGVDNETIYRWEAGCFGIRRRWRKPLAAALEIPLADLPTDGWAERRAYSPLAFRSLPDADIASKLAELRGYGAR